MTIIKKLFGFLCRNFILIVSFLAMTASIITEDPDKKIEMTVVAFGAYIIHGIIILDEKLNAILVKLEIK